MGNLMVGHSEYPACTGVENFQTEFVLYRQPALLPKNPVEMNRRVHVRNAVFGKQNHLYATLVKKMDEVANDGVNRLQIGNDNRINLKRALRPVPLPAGR